MSSIEELSKIIEGYYSKNLSDKALSILTELRNGKYHSASKKRNFLIGNYKGIILNLSSEEYSILKERIIHLIPRFINERNSRKIAYSLLSQIIEYSCYQNDFNVYDAYEKEIIRLAEINKEKYLYHVITLAQTCKNLFDDITKIENFFIQRYLTLSRLNSINYKYLMDFSINVKCCDKRKFLSHLYKLKPFRNDFIIKSFILQNEELKTLSLLI